MERTLDRNNLHQTSKDSKEGHLSKKLQESELHVCQVDFRKINV